MKKALNNHVCYLFDKTIDNLDEIVILIVYTYTTNENFQIFL